MKRLSIRTVGDAAVTVDFGNQISPALNEKVHALRAKLDAAQLPGIVDLTPTFRSLLITYDPCRLSHRRLCHMVHRLALSGLSGASFKPVTYVIPVLYGGAFGEDLPFVASYAGLTEEDVIALHSAPDYLIYMLGFLPGFSYLGGLDKRIETPRLKQPRQVIPAGSVGIGGNQTGIYPLDSPGGWQLIGRTPVRTYANETILYRAGDKIRFRPVERAEYDQIQQAVQAGIYVCETLQEAEG